MVIKNDRTKEDIAGLYKEQGECKNIWMGLKSGED
jgi:hypothetical protein